MQLCSHSTKWKSRGALLREPARKKAPTWLPQTKDKTAQWCSIPLITVSQLLQCRPDTSPALWVSVRHHWGSCRSNITRLVKPALAWIREPVPSNSKTTIKTKASLMMLEQNLSRLPESAGDQYHRKFNLKETRFYRATVERRPANPAPTQLWSRTGPNSTTHGVDSAIRAWPRNVALARRGLSAGKLLLRSLLITEILQRARLMC